MADSPGGDLRAEILAEIASGAGAEPVVEATAEAKGETDAPDVTAADDDTDGVRGDEVEAEAGVLADDADADGDDTAVSEPDDEDDVDDDVELKSDDPKVQKGLDQVRRAEKRMREAQQRRDAEFAERQKEWQAKVDRVAELDKLASRVKYDPAAVLRAFGVSDEDFELIAQSIYAESPALATDPKQKAAAQAKLREREKEDKLTATEKRIAELEAKLEQRDKAMAAEREAAAYIQQINTTASSKYPLVAHMLKVDPEDTSDALVATYNALGSKLQRAPKPHEVVAEYDRKERARLKRIGVDPTTIVKPAAPKKPANANAPAAAPAPAAKPTNGATKLTPDAERDAILAELAAARGAQA